MTPSVRATKECCLRSVMLAAIVCAVVLIPLLGHKPLTDWDEGIYAEVSREMLRGSLLVPHWNQQLWFEKPPLMLWITAASFRIFGVSEFTARLGSAMSGLALVLILHLWLERRFARLTAWLSTLMLLGTFGFLHICRLGEMDALLSLGCVLGLIGLSEVDQLHAVGWYIFWSGAAIGVMTKGAAAAPLFLVAILFALVQRWRACFSPQFSFGLALFIVVVAPWHIAMVHMFGREFLDEYLGLHVWSRATHQIEGHHTGWWFYLKVLLVSAPPFTLLYPIGVFQALRTGVLRAFALFGVVVVVFYSLLQTRLPHYIAPSYAAYTAVTAVYLAHYVSEARARKPGAGFWIKTGTFAGVFCVLAILITSRSRASLHSALLSDGRVLPDNKDSVALLRHALTTGVDMPGPLLVWRKGPAPINTDVFYARRPVQQVELSGEHMLVGHPEQEKDRYTNNPIPLLDAVPPGRTLVLLDRDLLAQLPSALAFTLIEQGREVVLGTVRPVAASPASKRCCLQ